MGIKGKKRPKKTNLLEMPDPERIKLIKEVREKLQQRITEAKLWQSLLEIESLTINGNMVYKGNEQLNGFCLEHKI